MSEQTCLGPGASKHRMWGESLLCAGKRKLTVQCCEQGGVMLTLRGARGWWRNG